ncbi:hypothetical protein, partial [Kutzneria sp. NPDC052558]|uniref:hypothetical protein n=1 Tax=Kutzneria sp. NPDC052558 TaxID=3364121 RepID=UPI0037CCBF84
MHTRRGFTKRLVALALSVTAATGAATALAAPAAQASDLGGRITRSEVISRAQYWVDHQPGDYNQKANGPDQDGRMYRRDCSGYVSMAWHLTTSLSTATLPGVSHQISRDDLKAGDILDYAGTHTILFDHWTDSNGHFLYYTFGATPVRHLTGSIGAASIDGHPNGSYRAYRYENIVDDVVVPPPPV